MSGLPAGGFRKSLTCWMLHMYPDVPVTTCRRTLIVEDDADACEATSRALRRRGYEVDCAYTVAETLERLAQDPPDALILDLRLADGDGLAALRHIRERQLPVRVAVVTGDG